MTDALSALRATLGAIKARGSAAAREKADRIERLAGVLDRLAQGATETERHFVEKRAADLARQIARLAPGATDDDDEAAKLAALRDELRALAARIEETVGKL